jgi:hypothetical protein
LHFKQFLLELVALPFHAQQLLLHLQLFIDIAVGFAHRA